MTAKETRLEKKVLSDGSFTVFAPANIDFFSFTRWGSLKKLLKSEHKEELKSILKYHVLSGNNNALSIAKSVRNNDGATYLKTVKGEFLSVYTKSGRVVLIDGKGNDVPIQFSDINKSNRIVHFINRILLPGNKY